MGIRPRTKSAKKRRIKRKEDRRNHRKGVSAGVNVKK